MKYKQHHCSICDEIAAIHNGTHPLFIKELPTGYLVLGDFQFYPGYCIFLCKRHANELHELPKEFRYQFLQDMSVVAEAIYKTFRPKKLNYELLGNSVSHLHWHIFPRYKDDPLPQRPIWCIDSSITCGPQTRPTKTKIETYKTKLLRALPSIV